MIKFLIITFLIITINSGHASSFQLVQNFHEINSELEETRVYGFTQRDVLSMDGDPRGKACSMEHKNDDFSNRWCHALIVKLSSKYLNKMGFSKLASSLISPLVFVPKEFVYDRNPSMADLVATEIPIYSIDKYEGQFSLTLFGDKAAIISFEAVF